MNIIKSVSLAFTMAFVLLTMNACQKFEKGILEVKKVFLKFDSVTNQFVVDYEVYFAKVASDDSYPDETEFNLSSGSTVIETGFYWPDASLRSLGYKYSNDRVHFFTDKEKRGKAPSEDGHWGSNNSGSSGSGSCLVGSWYSSACAVGDKGVIWVFNSNNTGSFSNMDCNGICTPMVYTFRYEVSGNTCKFIYDAQQPIVKCTGYQDSRPGKPNDDTMTFTCNGSELTVNSSTGSNTFTR